MCRVDCFPEDTVELGMVTARMSVIRNSAGVHLLGGQGHSGDVLLTFTSSPTIDPLDGVDDARIDADTPEMNAAFDECYRWQTNVDAQMSGFLDGWDLREAYHVMQDLIAAGYDPQDKEAEAAEIWLYSCAARVVADFDEQAAMSEDRVRLTPRRLDEQGRGSGVVR
jgi:hypothetical protein